MSMVEVGQSRGFWYHAGGRDRLIGLCQAAEYCANPRPYAYEYDRLARFDQHFQASGAPPLATQLRSVMMAHPQTAQFVFRDTAGWESKSGWSDDYEELATLLRRFEKAGLYNGLLPDRPGLTADQWKASAEGCDWTSEAKRFRQERWAVLAAADTKRGLVAKQQQQMITAKADRVKQKAYLQAFFRESDRVTLDPERQRAGEREREGGGGERASATWIVRE
jgi:hypothetical protein